jgi:hypothetical protein
MKQKFPDLFWKYKDKIVALLALCILVWLIFGSFLLFENYSDNFEIVMPQVIQQSENDINGAQLDLVQSLVYPTSSYPVAVMIDNHSLARPQSGLSHAQFIYESLVEGGATRFMAFFNANESIERIGPVRSARPYFVDWASEYQSLYIHAGGSPKALEKISQGGVYDVNEISSYGTKYFWRSNDFSSAPHNLFTSTEKIRQILIDWGLTDKSILLNNFFIYTNFINTSTTAIAQEVRVDFSEGNTYDAYFVYEPIKKVYIRYDGGKEKIDNLNSQSLEVTNIIIQSIPPEEKIDGVGRLNLSIVGKGNGKLFQQGIVKNIIWEKPFIGRTSFLNQDESPIQLLPGLTWIMVVPNDRVILYK